MSDSSSSQIQYYDDNWDDIPASTSEEMRACSRVHKKLEEFRHKAKYSDVTILVEGRTFKCHRVILAAVSKYFDAMFDGRFVESGSGELTVHEIDSESFEAVLLYAYTGNEPAIDVCNILSLLCTTQFLQVKNIKKRCIQYILSSIYTITNDVLLEILMFASATNIVSLTGSLRAHIATNFVSYSQSNKFLEMPFDELWEVVNRVIKLHSSPVLKNDDLFADSLVRWLRYHYKSRKYHVIEFSSVMRSKNVSPEYVEFVDRHYGMQLRCASEEWLRPKSGTLFDSLTLSDENPIVSSYGDYQFSRSESLSLHLFTHDVIFSFHKFKPDGFLVCNEDYDIKHLNSVVSDESSYLYCLKNAAPGLQQTFHAYPSVNMSASTSRILCPPPFKLYTDSCAFLKQRNCIYYNSTKHSIRSHDWEENVHVNYSLFSGDEDFFCYNVEMNKWFPVPQTGYRNSKCQVSLTEHDNLVYVVSSDHLQAYDYRSPQWIDLPKVLWHANCTVTSCSLNGKIYVDDGKYLQAFDPVAAKWEWTCEREENIMEEMRSAFDCWPRIVAYENLLWSFLEFISSEDDSDYYSLDIKIYSPETRQWHLPPVAVDPDKLAAQCCPNKYGYDFIKFITVFKSH